MPQEIVTDADWIAVKNELRGLLPSDIYDTWFKDLEKLDNDAETLVVGAPNDFAAIFLEDNYQDLIREKVQIRLGRPMRLRVRARVDEEGERLAAEERSVAEASARQMARSRLDGAQMRERVPRAVTSRPSPQLNPRNTFDNFIVGSSNQLAHAASLAVSQNPGTAYNPLFLYGDTGLGKTHLMHAISHRIIQSNADAHVVYVSCEKFTNEFMKAIQENTLVKFRRFYRSVDILLIDDIQFLANKERTQEEFFHTFNELFESQRQICLSSDRPASEIARLENRLVSRFQWGMVADIQAPDLETRSAILRKKADSLHYEISDEILGFLAQRITRNVRRLEGALLKVATYESLMQHHSRLDLETAEKLLREILQEEVQNQITIEKIQRKVVEYYDLRISDMMSKRRPANVAFPRQIAMYLSRLLTSQPLKEIGEAFGGRDHGTVIHACKTVENVMEQDDTVRRSVEYLTKQLSHSS